MPCQLLLFVLCYFLDIIQCLVYGVFRHQVVGGILADVGVECLEVEVKIEVDRIAGGELLVCVLAEE